MYILAADEERDKDEKVTETRVRSRAAKHGLNGFSPVTHEETVEEESLLTRDSFIT